MKNITLRLIAYSNIIIGLIIFLSISGYVFFRTQLPLSISVAANTANSSSIDSNVDKENTILINNNIIPSISNNSNIVTAQYNKDSYVRIPSIGVDTQFYSGDSITILNKGIWLMPNLGNPDDLSKPIVLAGHRWGADNLTTSFRTKNLFFNLPQIKVGDEIYLNWESRDFKYKVTYKEESVYVSRPANLILFTCKYYNSPVRIIVYAQQI